MVNVQQHDTKSVTRQVAVVIAVITVAVTALTLVVLTDITKNLYVAGYYTISALFDAVGVDESGTLSALVMPGTPSFYTVIGLSILDGLIKIVLVGFVIASIISVITSLDLRYRLLVLNKKNWKNHYIICGYSLLAERVTAALAEAGEKFIVIEKDPTKADTIKDIGYAVLHEDFATDTALRNASIGDAKAVLFLSRDEYSNLLGVVTARHLNKNVKIVSRARMDQSVQKMYDAGAKLCVVPEMLAGIEIGDAAANGVGR